MVLAPVVDVGSAGGIGDRSFGDTSDVVTAKAGAYAAGLRSSGGVLPVLKHFPGQGHADADTHEWPGDRAVAGAAAHQRPGAVRRPPRTRTRRA